MINVRSIDLRRCHKPDFNKNNKYILEDYIVGYEFKIKTKSDSQHMARHTHTHSSTCKTSDIWIRLVDCIVIIFIDYFNISFMGIIVL